MKLKINSPLPSPVDSDTENDIPKLKFPESRIHSGLDPNCRSTIPLCPKSFSKVMKSIDTFIFDADGKLTC